MIERLLETYKRYQSLQTGRIQSLPIAILMPHSACNCRCVMCDIWKDNKNLKQLNEDDIKLLLESLHKLGTKQVLMSGGEALLHGNFFSLCRILKSKGIKISLHSTGLLLQKHAPNLVQYVNDIIISLDGDELTHDSIRDIPGAFTKMREGIDAIRKLNPVYKITGRSVIHKLNFRKWPDIIEAAKTLGLDQISFLPADVSSHAFNREMPWDTGRQHEILIGKEELPAFLRTMETMISENKNDFTTGYIAESPEKIRKIYQYYEALNGLHSFPYKKCNAPWVSTVVEADGTVRPCFFHEGVGNIHTDSLLNILNNENSILFRDQLDMEYNETCQRCVCYLNLSPLARL
jgi:MoaA/NifB/PqqE/SkfB family radical SAM enzyme